MRHAGDELLGPDAGGQLRRVDDSTPSRRAIQPAAASRYAADADRRRVAALGPRRGERLDRRRRRRIARRADRQVDRSPVEPPAARRQLTKPVVGIRRRDETRHAPSTTNSANGPSSAGLDRGPAAACPSSVVVSDSTSPLRCRRGDQVAARVGDVQLDRLDAGHGHGRDTASRSSSMPSPVAAEMTTEPWWSAASRAAASGARSALFTTISSGVSRPPISASTSRRHGSAPRGRRPRRRRRGRSGRPRRPRRAWT